MIPVIPRQRQFKLKGAGKNPFSDVNAYLQEGFVLAKDQDKVSFSDILAYTSDASLDHENRDDKKNSFGEPDKCLAIELHGVTSIHTADAEMSAVASRNKRVKDPAFHFIISWPENEKPGHEAIFDAARHCLKALNLQDHQYMLAIHGNTDNIHCHIAVNRVHPLSFKSQHLSFAQRALHKAAREIEIKYGWFHDNGIYVVEVDAQGKKHVVENNSLDRGSSRNSNGKRESSVWTDPESLINWMRSVVAPQVKESLASFKNWQELHNFLEKYQITLTDSGGGGLRLTAANETTGEILDVAASKGLRILKRKDLEAQLGAFTTKEVKPALVPIPVPDEYPVDTNLSFKPWSIDNAENFTNPRRDIRRSREPKIAPEAADSLSALRSIDMVANADRVEMLLSGDALDNVDIVKTNADSGVRHRGAGASGTYELKSDLQLADRIKRRGRDPDLRAERKAQRAIARSDLQQQYQVYRSNLKENDVEYYIKKHNLVEAHKNERLLQTQAFEASKQLLKNEIIDQPKNVRSEALAILAAKHLTDRLALRGRHNAEVRELSATRPPPLAWREWLLERSQMGDQAAVSALRGIVYKHKREIKAQQHAAKANSDIISANSNMSTSPVIDLDTEAYIAFMKRLLDEEKKEKAIRGSDPKKVLPHECEVLLSVSRNLSFKVTGNGNVEFFDANRHLFTDRGNRITFDKKTVTDDEIRLALMHAKEKFGGRLTLTGDDAIFTERMAKIADDIGLNIINPELQPLINEYRKTNQKPVVKAGETSSSSIDMLKQSVLGHYPNAKIEVLSPGNVHAGKQFVGTVVALGDAGFAQHIGKDNYVIHAILPSSPLSLGKNAHVKYSGKRLNVVASKDGRSSREH